MHPSHSNVLGRAPSGDGTSSARADRMEGSEEDNNAPFNTHSLPAVGRERLQGWQEEGLEQRSPASHAVGNRRTETPASISPMERLLRCFGRGGSRTNSTNVEIPRRASPPPPPHPVPQQRQERRQSSRQHRSHSLLQQLQRHREFREACEMQEMQELEVALQRSLEERSGSGNVDDSSRASEEEASRRDRMQEILRGLPREEYSLDHRNHIVECELCLVEYELNAELIRLPCMHFFHSGCVMPWLQKSGTCPMCQLDVCRAIQAVSL